MCPKCGGDSYDVTSRFDKNTSSICLNGCGQFTTGVNPIERRRAAEQEFQAQRLTHVCDSDCQEH